VVQHAPTQYPTSEELQLAGINFKAFDLGGHEIARRVWRDYYAKARCAEWAGLRCAALGWRLLVGVHTEHTASRRTQCFAQPG
jgi:hypothetical protein